MRNYICAEHEDRLADMLADDITLPEEFWELSDQEQMIFLHNEALAFLKRIDDLIDQGINIFDLF